MTPDDDPNTGDDWLNQAMEGEDAAGCISVGGLAVDMGWYKKDRGMTPDEIEAEREWFAEACPEFPHTKIPVFGDPQFMFSHTRVAERAWMKRAAIARAEHAELRAEIERLRERVRGILSVLQQADRMHHLQADMEESLSLHKEPNDKHFVRYSEAFAENDDIIGLIKDTLIENGVEPMGVAERFDDQGNEVPLDKWRERMGGAG